MDSDGFAVPTLTREEGHYNRTITLVCGAGTLGHIDLGGSPKRDSPPSVKRLRTGRRMASLVGAIPLLTVTLGLRSIASPFQV